MGAVLDLRIRARMNTVHSPSKELWEVVTVVKSLIIAFPLHIEGS